MFSYCIFSLKTSTLIRTRFLSASPHPSPQKSALRKGGSRPPSLPPRSYKPPFSPDLDKLRCYTLNRNQSHQVIFRTFSMMPWWMIPVYQGFCAVCEIWYRKMVCFCGISFHFLFTCTSKTYNKWVFTYILLYVSHF